MNSESKQRHESEIVAGNLAAAVRPGVAFPANPAADTLARVVDEVRAEAQVAPGAYLSDAIVPKGGE